MTNDLANLASQQLGLITHVQALAGGYTPSAIRHKLATARWQRLLPGVYATFSGDLTSAHELYAALLYGGPSATLTGARACLLIGLRYVPDDEFTRLLVERNQRRKDAGQVRINTTIRLPAPDFRNAHAASGSAFIKPIPVAPPGRAVIDAARTFGLAVAQATPRFASGRPILTDRGAEILYKHSLQTVRALICEAVQRRFTTLEELGEELEDGPRQGTALARRTVSDVAAGCLSAPECELRDLLVSSEILPPARFNEPLPGYSRLRPDACWPERRLVVEIDSAEWHRRGDAYERTEQRRALLASMGWIVIPVSPQRLRACPAEVLAEIEAAYLAAARAA